MIPVLINLANRLLISIGAVGALVVDTAGGNKFANTFGTLDWGAGVPREHKTDI
jgi:hypothetical protein